MVAAHDEPLRKPAITGEAMHWIIDIILLVVVGYTAYQVELARSQVAGLAMLVQGLAQEQRNYLGDIDSRVDALTRQLQTPGTRHDRSWLDDD